MSELALKLIAENKVKHERGEDATYLDLGCCGLVNIPQEIGELVWLKELILSDAWNELRGGVWGRVESINNTNGETLIKNNIETLPVFLCNLVKLEKLILQDNQSLLDISPISALTELRFLNFRNTSVQDISAIITLDKLEYLFCPDTPVSNLQPLEGKPKLKLLAVSNSKVIDLYPLKYIKSLTSLYCFETRVKELTPLANLTGLETLILHKTDVEDLSPVLFLVNRKIPVEWSDETKPGIFTIKDCPLLHPPIEIAQKGNAAILQYFDELEKAKQKGQTIRLSEAKCLILGEGGAGKTSLAKKLLNSENELPEEQATTKGIDVYPHDLKLPDGTDFRLNIWDFGGQEIYHATHQFFLTKRSLYILLDDTRTSEKTVNDPSFNYWLQVAQLYGGNSPLLIVQNEKGDRSKQLDLRGMQGRFSFVKDSKATNLLTCRGLDEVWTAIEYWLKQLPHIGEEQPKVWVDIRRELERLAREEGRDHIPLEEYYRICAQHDIPERERALFLSSYLHDFGAFLHFQDHPLLRKTLVLNNQWATDAVYKVLDCEEVKVNFGRFTRGTLGRIWADDRYADQHEELLALMEKFELCYKLSDERVDAWLAPQLLSVLQPEALVWDDVDNLQIRYEYEFMPKGLLSQHIVRNHRYIRQTELAWKSGAVFERAGAQALVTEAWGSRNIRIRARGAQAKELLTLLSEDFDKMHERLEGLKVRKMIPCNCPKCAKASEPHFYDYDKLQRRKMDGKRTVECDLSYEDVSVVGLLDGVFAKHIPIDPIEKQSLKPLENMKKIFISYSKSDKAHLEEFKKQLSPFRRQNLVEIWDDSKIGPGEEWDKAIKRELATADIIVLLISTDLINTDYIWDVEMKEAMERHERKEVTVIPVIIRHCAWEKAPFGKLNALPEKGVPVEKWNNRDEAWTQVVKRIESLL